ncbi:hypothetical protein CBM2589_B10034 [Cupriavidus taiwanensis]|uniref:Uncharacterized protein n=1 Tax=Cupriavidus taiwanensis TaxID=164546 RepID=A0A975ZV30_9BURK|nr:hypothetical protein CBM2589_B10034 [Cupriavidus taiwanensis]
MAVKVTLPNDTHPPTKLTELGFSTKA